MDYEWKTGDQAEEISAKLPFTGIDKSIKNSVDAVRERKRKKGKDKPKVQETINTNLPDPLPERITITMLGTSGSGKTSFLSGVYQSLIVGSCCGVSMIGDDKRSAASSGATVVRQIEDIAMIKRGNSQEGWLFPVGTQSTVEYPLILQYQDTEICGFDFMDYAGGQLDVLLRTRDDALSSDQAKLKNQLRKSDELMIFAEADVIADYDVLEDEAELVICRNELGVDTIQPLFRSLSQFFRDRPMTVLIILTKVDKALKKRNVDYTLLVERVEKVYEDLWWDLKQRSGNSRTPWNIGIVPVTVIGIGNEVRRIRYYEESDGNVQTIEKDVAVKPPKPENIDAAMVYSVASILKQRCQVLSRQEQALVAQTDYGNEKEAEANEAWREKLESERRKLQLYVDQLTLNTDIIPKILERKDNLGW